MATVYIADDLRHKRRVAIKVVEKEIGDAIGAQRFTREIDIVSKLAHPNILPLYDSGVAEGLFYYVMPFIEGQSLRDKLRREGQLSIQEAVDLSREVASALEFAHEAGVVHRDIKPENILLQAGHALVSDFGIAHAIDSAAGDKLTATGVSLGTPAYMSPEQATAQAAVDGRSDIYSLGCVLYEMLSGSPPYVGATPRAVIARKLVDPVPKLRVVRETVSPALERAVSKALAKSPADRFSSAKEFSAAIHSALNAPVRERAVFSTRTRMALVAASLAVVALGSWWYRTQGGSAAPGIDSIAVLPFENLSHDSDQEYLAAGLQDALITELAQVGSLRVISRSSTLRFRNSQQSVSDIARELGVNGVVESTLMKTGDSVRVQVQLIQARPREQHLWAHTYSRGMHDVFGLQTDIAQAMMARINGLSAPESRRAVAPHEVDALAYEDYLRGNHALSAGNLPSADTAMRYFEAALKRDSSYAPIYMGIANVWNARSQFGVLAPDKAFEKAEPFVIRALQLDSNSITGYLIRADLRSFQWNWPAADREYRRALALAPNDARVLGNYAAFLSVMDHEDEATSLIQKALALDPLNPARHMQAGTVARMSHRLDEAVAHDSVALRIAPKFAHPHWALWQVYQEKGQFTPALAELREYFRATADTSVLGTLKSDGSEAGYRAALHRAADMLAERSKTTYVRPYWPTALYAYSGDTDHALDWMEKTVQERAIEVRNFRRSGVATGFENHPRYLAILKLTKLDIGLGR
jgi:serine/threonine-protein kinase